MNPSDSDLEKLLRSAKVSERSNGYWERFPGRVLFRLRTAEPPLETRRGVLMGWGLGFAVVCLMIGFGIGHWYGIPQGGSTTESPLVQNRKLFQEVAAMFPNQVRAIISDEHGVRLILADKQETPSSTPLFVQICDQQRCWDVITFSGQQVILGGKSYEVLEDTQGDVMVVGRALYWDNKEPRKPSKSEENVHIEAHRLDTSI